MATISGDFSTNLTSYWKLDETSGTRADAHGSNDLTEYGTGGVGSGSGIIINAADFEKADSDYLARAAASATSLNPTGDFSISFWYNAESFTNGNWAGLVSKTDTNLTPTYGAFNTGILRDVSTYYFLFSIYDGATPRGTLFTINSYVATSTWYHCVCTYNATTDDKKVYINATQVQSETAAVSSYSTLADFRIGWRNNASPDDQWDGRIDEVGFWNGRELTSAEVSTIYNSGAGIEYGAGVSTNSGFFRLMM